METSFDYPGMVFTSPSPLEESFGTWGNHSCKPKPAMKKRLYCAMVIFRTRGHGRTTYMTDLVQVRS